MASVDVSIRRLGGSAQFEHIARTLGWTPPGGIGPVSSLASMSLASMSDPAQCLDDDNIPMETDADQMDADFSNGAAASEDGALSSLNLTSRQLCLGNSTILNFTKEEVGDPPAISFANDIPHLVQTWDDTSDDWDPNKCVLHIQGWPIAIIYWREVYMYGKKGQWKGIQNRWMDWQVCVLFINLILTFDFPFLSFSAHCHKLSELVT
jgi:hypothetical protein